LLSQESFQHIFYAHGDFNPNNLLENIATPDYKTIDVVSLDRETKQLKKIKDKINLFKKLPNENKFLLV
jgi:hypothetical protein